ncbi:MAG: hypothetical protein IKR05_04480 [Prevotella sp.]|nr:hypothetical protein [Prevotella sp.]
MQAAFAQRAEWTSPHVGYSSTDMLTVDKVEFTKSSTLMHVTVSGREGTTFRITPTSCLKADGKRYALKKIPKVGIDKRLAMPKSGKVHFTMRFEPLPTDTKLMHFVEGDDDGGWHLCNIRDGKGDVTTEMTDEWKSIGYEDLEELPESRLCDDSTTIRVRILNYVPEAGRELQVIRVPFDFDQNDMFQCFPIAADGTATFTLHPCFPVTIYMRLGKGEYFPLLVTPGDECTILMDLEKGGTTPVVAFKGAFAKVNHELNVLGGKDFALFDGSAAHFDSLLARKQEMEVLLRNGLINQLNKIQYSKYSHATKEWMVMDTEYRYTEWLSQYNKHVEKKVEQDLKAAHSSILNNMPLWNKLRRGMKERHDNGRCPLHFLQFRKMTYIPHYVEAVRFASITDIEAKDNVHPYNKDIWKLFLALSSNEQYAYEEGLKKAEGIADPELKAYYPVAAKRWNDHVEGFNRIPHVHYDAHGGDLHGQKLKERLLEDYRGKNVAFLVYDRNDEQALSELEEIDPIIASTNDQITVFIHIDTNFMGVRGWLQSARRWHGEHYGGRRTRYDSMFNNHGYSASGILYELHAPDGATTLSTTDKKEALAAIENLKKE